MTKSWTHHYHVRVVEKPHAIEKTHEEVVLSKMCNKIVTGETEISDPKSREGHVEEAKGP